MTDSRRLRSLDGVRGLAAFVVVLWHAFLVAQPHLEEQLGQSTTMPGGVEWWLLSSPFSALISGEQAVLVFFLLSGIVLTLPVVRAARFDWFAYYPRRVVRLWLPVIVSVLLAAILLLIIPRGQVSATSWQWQGNAHSLNLVEALREASLTSFAPRINGPLWSLSWEMAFSVALPLFVITAVLLRRWWLIAIIVTAVVVAVGFEMDVSPLKYLPVFLIGAIAATSLESIAAVCERINAARHHRLAWSMILLTSIALLTASRFAASIAGDGAPITHIMSAVVIVGCMGLVLLAIGSAGARVMLESRPAQWLGRISFSLYLVHVPLMVTIAYAVGWNQWWLAIIIGIPASLVLATVFARFVEQPAHLLSRRVGKLAVTMNSFSPRTRTTRGRAALDSSADVTEVSTRPIEQLPE